MKISAHAVEKQDDYGDFLRSDEVPESAHVVLMNSENARELANEILAATSPEGLVAVVWEAK